MGQVKAKPFSILKNITKDLLVMATFSNPGFNLIINFENIEKNPSEKGFVKINIEKIVFLFLFQHKKSGRIEVWSNNLNL